MADINDFLLDQLKKLDSKLDEIKDQGMKSSAFLDAHEMKDQELRDDVKKINVSMDKQANLLGEYNQSLREHMKRTQLLENRLDPIEKRFVETTILEKHRVSKYKIMLAVFAAITSLLAGIAAVLQFIH